MSLSLSSDENVLAKTRHALRKFHAKYGHMRSSPSVHAGANVVTAQSDGWVGMGRHKHWDIAATAAMVLESGGVVQHLDGSPIRWDRVSMGAEHNPIIFAPTIEMALEICEAFDD